MGNSQSQSSDDDDKAPTYRYHEDILKNAQLHAAERRQRERKVPVYESENEEYFSAEEGDSDRSITPPRDRPESSSGEDFSDDSVDEDDENIAGSASQSVTEVTTVSTGSTFLVPSSRKQSCGQCNVSRFEEHDSITPELETSRWHLSDSSTMHNSPGNDSQNCSHLKDVSTLGKRQKGQSASPFVPIHSPPKPVGVSPKGANHLRQNTPILRSSQSPGVGEICVPPKKKSSSEVSPWKRGFGFYDSSDSEDDLEEEAQRRSHHSRSPKRAKLSAGVMSPGSKRGLTERHRFLENDGTDSVHLSPKHRRVIDRRALQTVISDSVKRSHADELHENESTVKRLRGNSMNLKQPEDHNISERRDFSQNPNGEVIYEEFEDGLMVSAFRSGANPNTGDPRFIDEKKDDSGKTFKMGANGVRNSHGKLLPVRGYSDGHQNEENNSERGIETDGHKALSSSLTNITGNLRSPKIAMELSGDNQLKMKCVSAREEISSATSPKKLRGSSTLQMPLSDAESYPLANVVLTPPSAESSVSDIQRDSSPKATHSSPKIKLKRVAERFKTFLTDGNLGTNFKSLFSTKRKLTDKNSSDMESSPSFSRSSSSLPDKHLFNASNHVCFSSSPDESSKSRSLRSKSFSKQPESFDISHNMSSTSTMSVSPIFATARSSSDTSTDKKSQRYSSLLEMSANARRKGTQQLNAPRRTPTRTSPRLHSNARPDLLLDNSPPSSPEIAILPRQSLLQVVRFKLASILEISVSMGDIADEVSAGIVNWTDPSLTHSVTKCSQKIAAKAGALMRAGCSDYLTNKDAVMEAPDVLTTPAGGRFPRSVEVLLHVVTPQLRKGDKHAHSMTMRLMEVYANCLRFANEMLGLRSLSLPLIGRDLFSDEVSINAFFDAVMVFITESHTKTTDSSPASKFDLTSVKLVLDDAASTDLAAELITERLRQVAALGIETVARNVVELCDDDETDSNFNGQLIMPMIEVENPDRTTSGRPRVKRPKL